MSRKLVWLFFGLLGSLLFASGANAQSWTYSGTTKGSHGGGFAATLLSDGMVLIEGGISSVECNAYGCPITNVSELYNPSTASFSTTGTLNAVRSGHTATLLDDGRVLIMGGITQSGVKYPLATTAELYSPSSGQFTIATGAPINARIYHTATMLNNGLVLIVGGDGSSGALSACELFNPATGDFTATAGSLHIARYEHTATLLNDGTVLIAGGVNSSGTVGTAEIYNPATGLFAVATGGSQTPRFAHTATLLDGGEVLIAGGDSSQSNPYQLASAELYNPSNETFTLTTGSMNVARASQTATILSNGTVLVAGGYNFDKLGPDMCDCLADVELYNPATGGFSTTGAFNTGRDGQTATLLPNGDVLAIGGESREGTICSPLTNCYYIVQSSELYEPASLVPSGLVSISLSPLGQWVPIGNAQIYTATGTFSNNSMETLASAIWISSNAAVAPISSDASNYGHAYAVANGSTTITACTGSICGSTTMDVAPHTNLLIGSKSGDASSSTFESYGDTGNLLQSGSLDVSRSSHSATLLTNGTIFVAGGIEDSTSWEIFNINGQVLSSGTLLNSFSSHVAVKLQNGNIFLAAGSASPATWEIRSSSGAYVGTGTSLDNRSSSASGAVLQNGDVWISGGPKTGTNGGCSTYEIYNASGTLLSNGSLENCFSGGKAIVLSNGNVLLVGTDGAGGPTVYEIRTDTGTFVSTGPITNTFDSASGAAQVGNNVFLFEEGYWEYVGFNTSGAKTFDTLGNLLDERAGAKGVLTSSGNIFITGGNDAPSTWEMWTPSGQSATLAGSGNLADTRYQGHSDTHF